MAFDFYKYHALGNDYLVIDPNHTRINLTPDNIRIICHRNRGLGSDGILYGPFFDNGLLRLRIFNPDGSEAEKSGNGIRIFAGYLWDENYQQSEELGLVDDQVQVSMPGGELMVEIKNDGNVFLTGSIAKIAQGNFAPELLERMESSN